MQVQKIRDLIRGHKRVGGASPPRPSNTTHAVHEQLGLGGKVVVDDIV